MRQRESSTMTSVCD